MGRLNRNVHKSCGGGVTLGYADDGRIKFRCTKCGKTWTEGRMVNHTQGHHP